MPKHLLKRRVPDSIREFRAAASERFEDGSAAEEAGRRTAAIYLWGYTAEMILKAAYFAAIGYASSTPITINDLKAARFAGIQTYGVLWPGNLHDVRAWADLLVEHQSRPPIGAYVLPGFGDDVKRRGRRIEPLWSETLRYHKNIAYTHEVERVREAAGWLLERSSVL